MRISVPLVAFVMASLGALCAIGAVAISAWANGHELYLRWCEYRSRRAQQRALRIRITNADLNKFRTTPFFILRNRA